MCAGIAALLIGGGVATQLAHQAYRPDPHIPTARDRQVAQAFIAKLRKFKGPLLIPYHPYYAKLAGKPTHYHQMGINDITRVGLAFPKEIVHRISQQQYDAILLDNAPSGRYAFVLRHYKFGRYFTSHEAPRMITGYRVSPRYLLVQNSACR